MQFRNHRAGLTGETVGTQRGLSSQVGRVSNHPYMSFDAGQAGVSLDHSGINGRTIVNQIAGASPGLIQGDITVAGSRAHVTLLELEFIAKQIPTKSPVLDSFGLSTAPMRAMTVRRQSYSTGHFAQR